MYTTQDNDIQNKRYKNKKSKTYSSPGFAGRHRDPTTNEPVDLFYLCRIGRDREFFRENACGLYVIEMILL